MRDGQIAEICRVPDPPCDHGIACSINIQAERRIPAGTTSGHHPAQVAIGCILGKKDILAA